MMIKGISFEFLCFDHLVLDIIYNCLFYVSCCNPHVLLLFIADQKSEVGTVKENLAGIEIELIAVTGRGIMIEGAEIVIGIMIEIARVVMIQEVAALGLENVQETMIAIGNVCPVL